MQATVSSIQCKSALNRVHGMPFAWSLNPYRGCGHACVYCYARSTHTYLDLGAGQDFSQRLFVKSNLPEVLEAELAAPRWRREEVAVGTATDPYQPLEARERLTRRCLQLLARYRTPATLITKGPMVRRDVDVLQELGRRAGCTVLVSIPTVDEGTWRRTEPGTPAPRHRLLAVRHLARAGIRVGVMLAPLLPGISDGRTSIAAAVSAAAEHEACFVHAGMLYLKPEVKAHYYEFLRVHYPHLLARYRALYPETLAPATVRSVALDTVREMTGRYEVADRRPAPIQPPERPKAVSLL